MDAINNAGGSSTGNIRGRIFRTKQQCGIRFERKDSERVCSGKGVERVNVATNIRYWSFQTRYAIGLCEMDFGLSDI